MKPLLFIALNTFKESVRNKILYNIIGIAGILIVLAVSVSDWSVFERTRVMEDMGMAAMSLTGMLLAIFIGVGLLGREISTKTVYQVVSKPLPRAVFITGKFAGLIALLLLNFVVLAGVLWAAIAIMGGMPGIPLLKAMSLIWVELAVLVAAAVFFSSWSTPVLSAIFTLGFYVAGHLNDLVQVELLRTTSPALEFALRMVYYIFPNLEHFNIRTAMVYGLPLPDGYVPLAILYGVLYTTLLLILSCVLFRKRDL
jgi:Cu-processing system permease protein